MLPALKRLWDDGFLLLVHVAAIALLQGMKALGLEVPLLERTGFWHLVHTPGTSAAVVLTSLALLGAIALAQRHGHRAMRAVACVIVAAGTLGFVFLTPALAFLCAFTASHFFRKYRAEEGAARQDSAWRLGGIPAASVLAIMFSPLAALLVAYGVTQLTSEPRHLAARGVFLAVFLPALVLSLGAAMWRELRHAQG